MNFTVLILNTIETILARFIGAMSIMIVSVIFISSQDESIVGYYYLFINLAFIKLIGEMGFTAYATQYILRAKSNKLIEIKEKINAWFSVSSILVFPLSQILLIIYDKNLSVSTDYMIKVWLPWVIYSTGMAVGIKLNGYFSILEGYHKIRQIGRYRILISTMYLMLNIFLIKIISGLMAIAVANLVSIGIVYLIVKKRNKELIEVRAYVPNIKKFKLAKDFIQTNLEQHWKVIISFVSGFFIFYSITPFVIREYGLEIGGKFGFMMQFYLFLASITSIAIASNMASISALEKEEKIKKIIWMCSVAVGMLLLVNICIASALKMEISIINDFVKNKTLGTIYLYEMMELSFYFLSFYLVNYISRMFVKETFWWVSMLHGAMTIAIQILLVHGQNIDYFIKTYVLIFFLMWVIAPIIIYLYKRREL